MQSWPRIKCPEHGVSVIQPVWSRANGRFTLLFESFMIDTLQLTQVRSRAAIQLRVCEEQLKRVQKQAVARGLAQRQQNKMDGSPYIVRHLCIDEKSLFTGHHYVSIIYDGQTGAVLEVVEHRTQDAAQSAFINLGDYVDLTEVQVVTMDMWKAFKNAANICVPQADIVHDRFHLAQYLNKAVDITRCAENKKLVAQNDERLKGSKYLWLKNPDNFNESQQQIFDTLKLTLLKVVKTFDNHLQGLLDYTKHRVRMLWQNV